MRTLNQHIEEKKFLGAYLFYGNESFLIRNYKHRLREAVLGDDSMNYSYYEGKGIPLNEVADLSLPVPFFAE